MRAGRAERERTRDRLLAWCAAGGPTPRQLFVAALVAWAACTAVSLIVEAPLHGDEAVYAVLARGDGGWAYRSSGMAVLGRLGIWLGGGELAMRGASAVLGLGVLVAVAAVGRALGGPRVGAWAAAVVAGAHPFVLRSGELLGDLPATAAVLGAIAIAIEELGRAEGPRYRLVAAAPLLALAFYVRYGSVAVIGIVALVSLVLWWRAVLARPGPVIATAAVLAALAVPFVVLAVRTTGSAIGPLSIGRAIAGHTCAYPGAGLVGYLAHDPFVTYGVLATPLAVIGVARARTRMRAYLAVIALAEIVVLGLTTHPEGRYVLLATALLVVLGVAAIADRLGRGALVLVALSWASCAIIVGIAQAQVPAAIRARGEAIRADAAGRDCVVIARRVPQIMWYSGCDGAPLWPSGVLSPLAPDARWYAADVPGQPAIDIGLLEKLAQARVVAIGPGVWRVGP